jgi:hypothetical protein
MLTYHQHCTAPLLFSRSAQLCSAGATVENHKTIRWLILIAKIYVISAKMFILVWIKGFKFRFFHQKGKSRIHD